LKDLLTVNSVTIPMAPRNTEGIPRLIMLLKDLIKRYGARFPTEIYTRGCHWIPRMFA
jgi:hypothetical protein